MPIFFELYQTALNNYIQQTPRTHHTQMNEANHRIYTFGWFSSFRHSRTEYPRLIALKMRLQADHSAEQLDAKAAIVAHFNDDANKWNHHSFNNYLFDEIKKHADALEWQNTWLAYDKKPILYYRGILFRGTGAHPTQAFKNGLIESNDSNNLEDYIKDMNGAIGVSTSKLFRVANGYALPNINPKDEYADIWHESYIYVIDYQGTRGIDLEQTFNARQHSIAAYLSGLENGKAEVNVIEKIEPQHIVGAFYVNRMDQVIWHANPEFDQKRLADKTPELLKQMPANYKRHMMNASRSGHIAQKTSYMNIQ
jgi:hypothetical protein